MPAAMALPVAAQTTTTDLGPFDSHQSDTIAALSELIIPGAKAAQVPRYIETILRDSTSEERQRFADAVSWLDGYSIRTQGKPFVRLASSDAVKVLETLENSTDEDLAPGHEFVGHVKSFTARVYYSTREGFADLNRGGRVPATFACAHDGKEHA